MSNTTHPARRNALSTYVAGVKAFACFCWPVALYLLCQALGG